MRSWSLALFLCVPAGLEAQDPKKDAVQPEDKKFQLPFFDTDRGLEIRAAVSVIGETDALRALAARIAISESVPILPNWQFEFDRMLPLFQYDLDRIQDGRPLPDVRAKEPRDLKPPDRALYLSYLQALRRSSKADLAMFERSAEGHADVRYTHLAAEPKRYRGQIITVTGRIKAIRANYAPVLLAEDGIDKIYTSWIITSTKGAPPFGVVFTELPKELKISESLDAQVTFYGYFLANVKIAADGERGNTKKDMVTPWLVGKTLIVQPKKEAQAEEPYAYEIIVYSVGGIVVVAVLVVLLNVWARRGDRQVQSKLADVRDKHRPFKLEVDDADAAGEAANNAVTPALPIKDEPMPPQARP